MRRLFAVIVCFACLLFVGCASEEQLALHHKDIAETVTEGNKDLSEEHVLILKGNVDALREQSEKTVARADDALDRAEAVYATALENKHKLEQLGNVALTVADIAAGGRVKVITDTIRDLTDKNRDKIADNEMDSAISIKDLKGMSTQEIAAILAAALGATGAGKVLSKMGKSRASEEITELKEIAREESKAIAELKHRFDLKEPPV